MPNLTIVWTKKARIITNFAAIVRAQMAPKMAPFENNFFSPKFNSFDNLLKKLFVSLVILNLHLKGHLLIYKGLL